MRLGWLHRRLSVGMCLAALLAFAGGAGLEPLSAALAAAGLLIAFWWQPGPALSERLDRLWLAGAALLSARAVWHVAVVGDDVVVPIVDLLFLLMVGESLRTEEGRSDARLYALSFALLLAATAYRPGILFATAFLAYIVLATITLAAGHLRHESMTRGVEAPRIGRPFFVATVGVSAITLLTSGFVFVAFPRVPRGWAGRGPDAVTSMVGFGDRVALDAFGAEIRGNPEIVLRVEFPEGRPGSTAGLHWKGRSYDHFDGVRWSRSPGLLPAVPDEDWYLRRWSAPLLRYRVFATPLEERVIFTLHPLIELRTLAAVQPLLMNSGDLTYWGRAAPAYEAASLGHSPSPLELRSAPEGQAPAARFYLQLPPLDPRLERLADSLVAGAHTRYDRAVAIQRWLQTELGYTTELPRTAAETGLENFLFERREGHCEYFSTAMVVMLRSVGIPARNVNGFLGGRWNGFGDYLVVTQNEAHSWVEVWFPGYGWITFDPTPSGTGAGGGALAGWQWPGRFLLDGIEHSWNKWVLDYDMAKQIDLFRAASGALRSRPGSAAGEDDRVPWGPLLLVLGLAGACLVAWRAALTGAGRSRDPFTRAYLKVRRVYERADLEDQVARARGPLDFLAALERAGAPARPQAARVVELYVRARFGGEPLGEVVRREQAEALDQVKAALRRGWGGAAPTG